MTESDVGELVLDETGGFFLRALEANMSINSETNLNNGSKSGNIDPNLMITIDWIAYAILGPIIVGIGILGNVLNLIVLTRPSLKGVTYTYLIGLACSDLGVLLCAIPMMIRQIRVTDGWSYPMSFFYGHLELPLSNHFMASSIFIVVCLTVDRFASVCLPTKFKSVHTDSNAKRGIFTCYILAFVLSLPLAFLKELTPIERAKNETMIYKFTENERVTHTLPWGIYTITEASLVRFIPAIILATLNILIIRRFRKITQKRREMLSGTCSTGDTLPSDQFLLRGERISKRIYKEEKRLVILLTVIVLLFFLTMTPVAFLGIFYSEKYDNVLSFQIFRAAANNLELCNFALNFYVYFLCSKEFRKKFLSFFIVLLPQKAKANFQSITLPEMSQNNVRVSTRVPIVPLLGDNAERPTEV